MKHTLLDLLGFNPQIAFGSDSDSGSGGGGSSSSSSNDKKYTDTSSLQGVVDASAETEADIPPAINDTEPASDGGDKGGDSRPEEVKAMDTPSQNTASQAIQTALDNDDTGSAVLATMAEYPEADAGGTPETMDNIVNLVAPPMPNTGSGTSFGSTPVGDLSQGNQSTVNNNAGITSGGVVTDATTGNVVDINSGTVSGDPQGISSDGTVSGAITGEPNYASGVDKILVEEYGWTLGDDGKANANMTGAVSGTDYGDPTQVPPNVGGGGQQNEPNAGDGGGPATSGPATSGPSTSGPSTSTTDLPPNNETGDPPEEETTVVEEETPVVEEEEEVVPTDDGGGTPVDESDPNDGFADQNNDGYITSLEAEIANLRQQLALLTNSSTQDTDGMTREEILALIAEAMRNQNASNYNPLAYMNAFGFAAQPNYFGQPIPTFMSQDGVYERRAVRDKDTGEIRYVNVPIGNASLAGTGGFQRRRRAGFGGNFDNF